MNSLKSALYFLGIAVSVGSISFPVLAAPQSEDSSASSLGGPITLTAPPLLQESETSPVKKADTQLGINIAMQSNDSVESSFRWQSELLNGQRRSESNYPLSPAQY